jgi:carboxyl-terminal processing protease
MEETKLHRQLRWPWVAIIISLVCAFGLGIYVGFEHRPWIERAGNISHKEPEVVTNADFEPFWKAWNIIKDQYPFGDKITDQDMVWGAINGLMSSLGDPYSTFFPPEESKSFNEEIEGSFGGIGMEVGSKEHLLTVIAPIKGSPAERAGIRSGDIILKIDGKTANDLPIDKAIDLIRGEPGTTVKLTIYREGEPDSLEFSIKREKIDVPVINGELRSDGIYVISLYSFNANSAPLFRKELEKFEQTGVHKLILDLRGNPGGFLDAAIDIGSYFIPQGSPIVIEDYGNGKDQEIHRSYGYASLGNNFKMAVLVDGGSASASEILAGALSEQGVAKLIGEQTFGKGSVQKVVDVTPETSLKLTIAKWLTPKGVSISEKGLTPDIVVKPTKADYEAKRDVVLNRAVEYLTTGK